MVDFEVSLGTQQQEYLFLFSLIIICLYVFEDRKSCIAELKPATIMLFRNENDTYFQFVSFVQV